MVEKFDKNLTGTAVNDELHNSLGSSYYSLDHDTFFGGNDFDIFTASGGGGVNLVEGIHYSLHDEDTGLTAETGKTVYTTVKIIDPTYQSCDLYFVYKTVGDYNEAGDINDLHDNLVNGGKIPVRQSVLAGGIDSNGYANFLSIGTPATTIDLAASATNILMAFAKGFNLYGQFDYLKLIDADDTPWTGLSTDDTYYLYAEYNSVTKAVTYGKTSEKPGYGYAKGATGTSDKHYFVVPEMKMYRDTGATWEEKIRLFLGECVVSGNVVTSVTTYALNGQYDSGWFNVSTNTEYTKDTKIGSEEYDTWGYVRSSAGNKARKINNSQWRHSFEQAYGDHLAQIDDVVYYRTAANNLGMLLSASLNWYPYTFSSGQARIYAKRGW